MTPDPLQIKLTPLPYRKRRANSFMWTLVLYLLIAIMFGLSCDVNTMLLIIPCLAALFFIDYLRRLLWVKYAIDSIETDPSGFKLSYYNEDELLMTDIAWEQLSLSRGSTFTKGATKILYVKSGSHKVASFYADADTGIDNSKIDELYQKLYVLKSAFTSQQASGNVRSAKISM